MRIKLAIGAFVSLVAILLGCVFLPKIEREGLLVLESTTFGARLLAKRLVEPERAFAPEAWKKAGLTPESFQLDLGHGIKTLGLYVSAPKPSKGTVILLHGYANCLDVTAGFSRHLHDAGYNTLSIDQRGHGHNTARFCSFGFAEKQDVACAISFLETKGLSHGPFMVVGTSMGAAVGIQAMESDPRIRCGVFDSSFDTLMRVAPSWIINAGIPNPSPVINAAEDLIGSKLDSISPVSSITRFDRPVFVLHGQDDGSIPKASAMELFNRSPSPKKRLLLVDHANHAQVLADEEPWTNDVWSAIIRFLDENRA